MVLCQRTPRQEDMKATWIEYVTFEDEMSDDSDSSIDMSIDSDSNNPGFISAMINHQILMEVRLPLDIIFGINNINDDSNSIVNDDSAFDFLLSASSNSSSSSISTILLAAIIEKEHEVFMNSKQTHNYLQFGDEMVIEDLPDNVDEVIECYHFRKCHIETIANLFWNKFSHLFNSPYDKLLLPNRNYIHFETGLLLLLFCFARPVTIQPAMTSHVLMNRNNISKALTYFFEMMYQISTPYLTDITIWRDYIPMLNWYNY
jgi:hypothetical protein